MTRMELPLLHRTLWASGDVLIRGELDLRLKSDSGIWEQETFVVDSGSEISTMPAFRAKQLNLPMPKTQVSGAIHQPSGLPFRSGVLRVQIVGMDQTEYAFPCFFLGDPDQPINPGLAPALVPKNLIGLSGVTDKVELRFAGRVTPYAPYGSLIVEKL